MAIQGGPLGGEPTSVGAVAAQRTRHRLENWDPAGQFVLVPLADVLVFPPMDVFIRAATWPLMVFVVGLVLLVACTNLASFLLARARSAQGDCGAPGAGRAGRSRGGSWPRRRC